MITLLDVNVLVALAWPNHVHHDAACSWFEKNHAAGWATCSVTESGFVRVSSNASIVDEARTPGEAILLLREITDLAGHHFWTDDVSIARSERIDPQRIHGHRQVMDAHLLALAASRGGRLASFDRRIADLIPPGTDRSVLITLKAG